MKKLIKIILINIIFVIGFSGCGYLILTVDNVGDSLFDNTKKVENKEENPVKNNVKMSALWAGHSSVFVQLYDKTLIFDPFFNDHLGGIFSRKVEAGIDLDKITKLDLICISHSHMDHLCFSSIGDLTGKFPDSKLLFPYGLEYYLPPFNVEMIRVDNRQVSKNNFGKPEIVDNIKVTPVFAAHTGGRYGLDTYTWLVEGATGYILEYKDLCIYFAGDTGYDSVAFKNIGNNFKIDLAFIPIGPCGHCDSTGNKYHTSSLEALELFKDIKAKRMIPIHYGAVKYSRDENYPLYVMEDLLKTSKYSYLNNNIYILKIGEQIIFNDKTSESTGTKNQTK